MDISFIHQLEILKKLFPFFLIIDKDGIINQLGESSKKLFTEELLNKRFDNIFCITSPIFVNSLEESVQFSREVFILKYKLDNHISLKGQLLQMSGSEAFLFVGNPIIKQVKKIKELNLNNNDFAIFDSLPEYLFGLQTQLTSLRDATELSKKLNIQANQLKKTNEELKVLNYVASHDIKEPIRNIGNYMGLIRRKLPNPLKTELNDYFKTIRNSVNQLYTLVEDIGIYLSMSSEEDIEKEQVNMNELVESVFFSLDSYSVEKSGELINHHIPNIETSSTMMYIILKNLVENGLKYNESCKPFVELSYVEHEKYHQIFVEDNGIGIEQQYKEQVFERFKRLHDRSKYQGSGIGLSIVKLLVEKLNGTIEIQSIIGNGTTFTLNFPKEQTS
jgi:signal transduction histidine kinase